MIKTKKAVKHALKDLGYYDWINGTWSTPDISLREMIHAICYYLDVRIVRDAEPKVVAVSKLPTTAKKESK